MNEEDFLLDMLNYYTNDVARVNHGYCINKAGIKDPVGRFVADDETLKRWDNIGYMTSVITQYPEEIEHLPDWMREYDMKFLQEIQSFYDDNKFWNKVSYKGLTQLGKAMLIELLNNYKFNKKRFEKYIT